MKNWILEHKLAVGGLFGTVLYFFILFFLISKERLEAFDTLKLNEIGDFLAGAFGPLAIFWLVLGFFQQGIELRLNSDALKLQAEELRNSVEQQKQMVQVASDQHLLERERAAQDLERQRLEVQPLFVRKYPFKVVRGTAKNTQLDLSLRNIGASCSNCYFTFGLEKAITLQPGRINLIDRDSDFAVWLTALNGEPFTDEPLYLHYTDRAGIDQTVIVAHVSKNIHTDGDVELGVKVLSR